MKPPVNGPETTIRVSTQVVTRTRFLTGMGLYAFLLALLSLAAVNVVTWVHSRGAATPTAAAAPNPDMSADQPAASDVNLALLPPDQARAEESRRFRAREARLAREGRANSAWQ